MVLTLAKDQPAHAGFFFRDRDGAIDGSRSPLTFAVEANPMMRLRPPRKTAAPATPPRNAPLARPVEAPQRTSPSRARPLGFSPIAEYPTAPPPTPPPVQSPLIPSTQYEAIPPELLSEPDSVAFRWRLLAIVVIALASVGVALITRPLWLPASSDGVGLRLEESQGQLVIQWDLNARAVRQAQRASLRITDGSTTKQVELNEEEIRRGTVTYAGTGEDVEVRLTLVDEGGQQRQESTRFVGQLRGQRAAAGISPQESLERLRAERDRLQRALLEQRARATELRRTLRQLESPRRPQ
jgi:hypothetical protein